MVSGGTSPPPVKRASILILWKEPKEKRAALFSLVFLDFLYFFVFFGWFVYLLLTTGNMNLL